MNEYDVNENKYDKEENIEKTYMSLEDFLCENRVDNLTSEFYPSKRFKDAGMLFKVKAMSSDEYNEYQQECLIQKKKKTEFNTKRWKELLIINHTVIPNFRDAGWLNKLGCNFPQEALNKVLKPGELDIITGEIQNLSGLGESMEDMVNDVKNS